MHPSAIPITHGATIIASDIPTRTDFVGRQTLLAQAKSILTNTKSTQTLALWGLGGAGKTTLAAALAEDPHIRQHFSDGVLWVSIGQEQNPQACLTQILNDLGLADENVQHQTVEAKRGIIRVALASRHALIVLDDVWRVEDTQTLFLGGKGAGYLITTRQMAIAHTLANAVLHLEDFDRADTYALLRWHLPDEILRQAQLQIDLDEFAIRLNGLPLAVSVCARKLAYLARTRQRQRFTDYITDTSKRDGALAFAERLSASIQSLDADTRAALAALSLFPSKPNTFSADFACTVAACTNDTLNSLVDLGLVEYHANRYSMHPRVAEFAAGGINLSTAQRHIVEYCALALTEDNRMTLSVRDTLNVCAALDQAQVLGEDSLYVSIADNSAWLFERSGNTMILIEVLRNALKKKNFPTQRHSLEMQLALANWRVEPSEQRYTQLRELTSRASETDDANLTAMAARTMADISFEHDDMQASIDYIHSATHAWTLQDFQLRHKERIETAAIRGYMLKPYFENLRNLLVRIIPKAIADMVDSSQVLVAMSAKGWLDFLAGDVAPSVHLLRETFARALKGDHRLPIIFSAGALAWAYHNLGDYNNARNMAYHAIHSPHRDIFPEFVVQSHNALAAAALAQGNRVDAWEHLMNGLAYCEQRNADAMASELYVTMCEWHLLQGQLDEAANCAQMAHEIACRLGFHTMLPATQTMVGAVASHCAKIANAETHFNAVSQLFQHRPRPNPWVEAFFRLHYGRHLVRVGDDEKAKHALNTTVSLGHRLGSQEHVGLALFELAKLHIQHKNIQDGQSAGHKSVSALRSIGHVAADQVLSWLQTIH